jgi:acetolactate decarboxylase
MHGDSRRHMQRVVWAVLSLVLAGCSGPQPRAGTLYQVSTLQALMEGAYDGVVTCGELRRHGDLGIGTFAGLDGEMVLVDGQVFQVRSDGQVRAAPDSWRTPFATVARFRPDRQVDVAGPVNAAELAAALDRQLPTRNFFYMARIDGPFSYVKARSIPAQKQPYPPLADAARQQSVFELKDVEGTLIALRCPPYAEGVNMAGWHMHFISRDRRQGGHVLDLHLAQGRARIARLGTFVMTLPERGRFVEADLTRSTADQIKKVEQ